MLHLGRDYSVKPIKEPEEFEAIKTNDWASCTAWQFDHDGQTYLLLNDSLGGSGGEYVLARIEPIGDVERMPGEGVSGVVTVMEFDSITIPWVQEPIRAYLLACIARGPFWPAKAPFKVYCTHYTRHARCPHCA